jgi:hypothetical protein
VFRNFVDALAMDPDLAAIVEAVKMPAASFDAATISGSDMAFLPISFEERRATSRFRAHPNTVPLFPSGSGY